MVRAVMTICVLLAMFPTSLLGNTVGLNVIWQSANFPAPNNLSGSGGYTVTPGWTLAPGVIFEAYESTGQLYAQQATYPQPGSWTGVNSVFPGNYWCRAQLRVFNAATGIMGFAFSNWINGNIT